MKLNGYTAIQFVGDKEITGEALLVKDSTLLIVVEGTLDIRYGTAAYTIEKNCMALLKKGISLGCSAGLPRGLGDNTKVITVCFRDEILNEFVRLAQLAIPPPGHTSAVTVDEVDGRLLKFVQSLDPYFYEPETIDENLTRIKVLELLFNLVRSESTILTQLMDLRPHFRADITATVEGHVTSPISLPQLAELSGRSLSSFKRDFFAIYNMPPSTWLRLRRLEKARELFLNTTMTVTDVCYTLGFENLAHFSRLFKRHFGHSPSRSRSAALKVA